MVSVFMGRFWSLGTRPKLRSEADVRRSCSAASCKKSVMKNYFSLCSGSWKTVPHQEQGFNCTFSGEF